MYMKWSSRLTDIVWREFKYMTLQEMYVRYSSYCSLTVIDCIGAVIHNGRNERPSHQ